MNATIRFVAVAVATLALPSAAWAGTLKVPGDHTTIQDAVDAAVDGDTILVSRGTYPEAVFLLRKTDLVIKGKGKPLIQPPEGQTGLHLQACTGLSVSGLVIEGGAIGVVVNAGEEILLSKVLVKDSDGAGIRIQGGTNLEVTGCTVESPGGAGISCDTPQGLALSKCTVDSAGAEGVLVTGAVALEGEGNSVVLTKCVVRGMTVGAGISYSGASALLEKAKVEDTDGAGIVVVADPEAVVTIAKNRVSRTGGAGIDADGTAVVLTRNRVTDAGSNGFAIQGSGALLEKNQAKGGTVGFSLAGTGDHRAFGNKSRTTAGNGFNVTSPDNDLEKNSATASGTDGYFVTTGGNTFTSNKAKGSGGKGLNSLQPKEANTFAGKNRFGTEQYPQ